MLILITILLTLFYFLFPILIIYSTQKIDLLKKLGVVVMAYGVGMLIGNIGLIPRASDGFNEILKDKTTLSGSEVEQLFIQGLISESDLVANQITSVQNTLVDIVILLAIPLLLFSLDFRKSLKLAKEALFSLLLAMISLLLAIFVGYFIYKDLI